MRPSVSNHITSTMIETSDKRWCAKVQIKLMEKVSTILIIGNAATSRGLLV